MYLPKDTSLLQALASRTLIPSEVDLVFEWNTSFES